MLDYFKCFFAPLKELSKEERKVRVDYFDSKDTMEQQLHNINIVKSGEKGDPKYARIAAFFIGYCKEYIDDENNKAVKGEEIYNYYRAMGMGIYSFVNYNNKMNMKLYSELKKKVILQKRLIDRVETLLIGKNIEWIIENHLNVLNNVGLLYSPITLKSGTFGILNVCGSREDLAFQIAALGKRVKLSEFLKTRELERKNEEKVDVTEPLNNIKEISEGPFKKALDVELLKDVVVGRIGVQQISVEQDINLFSIYQFLNTSEIIELSMSKMTLNHNI